MPVWVDSIIVGLLITTVVYLVYRNYKTRVVFKTMYDMYLQAVADKMLMEQQVKDLYQEIENVKLSQSDGFVKFLSDSRDWAYEYIEQTQKALIEFDEVVTKAITWSEGPGTVMGYATPHANRIKEISEAYSKLKDMLPKNNETPND